MSLTLTNIPTIMRAQGWHKGATLMDQWFNRSATQQPKYSATDNSTITVDWVLGYTKPKELYDSIFNERIWANAPARALIQKRLTAQGLIGKFQHSFDQTVKPAESLESEYINTRPYGGGYSGYSGSGYSGSGSSGTSGDSSNLSSATIYGGLNDLIAAIGAFTFRVVVAGSVTPKSGGQEVTITKVGVYIRDSYDFDGFQFLGFWDDSDNTVSAVNPFTGDSVYNSSFRDYRDTNKVGGDYMIFSNVKTTTLTTPHVFML